MIVRGPYSFRLVIFSCINLLLFVSHFGIIKLLGLETYTWMWHEVTPRPIYTGNIIRNGQIFFEYCLIVCICSDVCDLIHVNYVVRVQSPGLYQFCSIIWRLDSLVALFYRSIYVFVICLIGKWWVENSVAQHTKLFICQCNHWHAFLIPVLSAGFKQFFCPVSIR